MSGKDPQNRSFKAEIRSQLNIQIKFLVLADAKVRENEWEDLVLMLFKSLCDTISLCVCFISLILGITNVFHSVVYMRVTNRSS